MRFVFFAGIALEISMLEHILFQAKIWALSATITADTFFTISKCLGLESFVSYNITFCSFSPVHVIGAKQVSLDKKNKDKLCLLSGVELTSRIIKPLKTFLRFPSYFGKLKVPDRMNSSTPMKNEFMVPDCKLLFIGVNRPFHIPGIRQST